MHSIRLVSGLAALLAAPAAATAQAPAQPLVSTEWLAARLGQPGIVILHVESRRERYETGHVPGARYIDANDIVVRGDPAVDYEIAPADQLERVLETAGVSDGDHIVITSTSPLAATRLWLTLDWLGLADRASIVDGFMTRWNAEARPLATESPVPAPGRLTVRPRTDLIVKAEWILERLEDPAIVLLDARPDAEYTGEDGGMGGMAHPGHIPGAWSLYWEELIRDLESDPRFLDRDALRARYEATGAAPGRTVVAYCMIGARASLTHFVGRMLGYQMKFYDGSWHDWGTRDLPYVRGSSRR